MVMVMVHPSFLPSATPRLTSCLVEGEYVTTQRMPAARAASKPFALPSITTHSARTHACMRAFIHSCMEGGACASSYVACTLQPPAGGRGSHGT